MQLMILRHGEAEPYASSDDNRALTLRGRSQVDIVGRFMAQLPRKPDLIAYSPLVRTTQTATIILENINIRQTQVWPELIHSSTAEQVEQKLMQSGSNSVLLVSHMPLVASLEAYLIEGESHLGKRFNTAELSIMSGHDTYPGGWQLEQRRVLS